MCLKVFLIIVNFSIISGYRVAGNAQIKVSLCFIAKDLWEI